MSVITASNSSNGSNSSNSNGSATIATDCSHDIKTLPDCRRILPTEPLQLPAHVFIRRDGQRHYGILWWVDQPLGQSRFIMKGQTIRSMFFFQFEDGVYTPPMIQHRIQKTPTASRSWHTIFVDEVKASYYRANGKLRQFSMEDYRLSGVGFANPPAMSWLQRDECALAARMLYQRLKFVTVLAEHFPDELMHPLKEYLSVSPDRAQFVRYIIPTRVFKKGRKKALRSNSLEFPSSHSPLEQQEDNGQEDSGLIYPENDMNDHSNLDSIEDHLL